MCTVMIQFTAWDTNLLFIAQGRARDPYVHFLLKSPVGQESLMIVHLPQGQNLGCPHLICQRSRELILTEVNSSPPQTHYSGQ